MTEKRLSVWLGGAALLFLGLTLGVMVSHQGNRDPASEAAVRDLSVRSLRLTDEEGRTRAELKSDGSETSLVFFDDSKRERLTLALGQGGVAIAINGRNDKDKVLLSINDSLRTSSFFLYGDTSAINLTGTHDAQLKISDSLVTDAHSTQLGVSERVTKLRLSTDGAEAQLFTKGESDRRHRGEAAKNVELNMRTAMVPELRFRLSTEEKPLVQLPENDKKAAPKHP